MLFQNRVRSTMRPIAAVAVFLSLSGCYAAHERGERSFGLDASALPLDASPIGDAGSCSPVMGVIEVPLGGCTEIVTNTNGDSCDGESNHIVRFRRFHRPPSSSPWYFLIRSRDPEAARVGIGTPDVSACTCRGLLGASGGDLTRSGVGGTFDVTDTEIDLVLDGDERFVWLRACDGPR